MAAILLSGCSATRSWFTKTTTQAVLADGCKAAAADDNVHNMVINQVLGTNPQAAPFLIGINEAHIAIQAAYARCVSQAMAMANGNVQ